MNKKIYAFFLAVLLLFTMTGCDSVAEMATDELAGILSEYTGLDEGTIRAQLSQNEKDLKELEEAFKSLSDEALAALLKELGIEFDLDLSLPGVRDAIWDAIEKGWGKTEKEAVQQNYGKGKIITGVPIPEDEIVETLSLNTSEFHPLKGFAKTMMGDQVPPESESNSTAGGGKFKHNFTPEINLNSSNSAQNAAAFDAITFVMDWIGNSTEVTLLQVKKAADGRVNIEYGSAIESRYSGKRHTLSGILVDNYYKANPSIVFTCGQMADERIRNWFGLSGDGTYSMSMKFGKVYVGECGYRLVLEDNVLYQIPIIHEDTEFNVYYREKGKSIWEGGTYLFDAADALRQLKIPVAEDEAEKIMKQLRENDIIE